MPDRIAAPNFATLTAEALGADDLQNEGINGISFSSLSPVLPEWSLCRRVADLPVGDLTILAAGTNDFGTNVPLGSSADTKDVSFFGALHIVLGTLSRRAAGKRVVLISPILRQNEEKNRAGFSLDDYRRAIHTVAERYRLPILDGKTFPVHPANPQERARYMPDGTHPNEEGHRLYAAWLLRYLLPT